MNRMHARLLKRYTDADYVSQSKARFLFNLCLAVLVIIPIVTFYSAAIQLHNPLQGYIDIFIVVPLLICFCLTGLVVFVLHRGHLALAGHLALVVSLLTVWMVMFLDQAGAVARLDSIAFVLGLLVMTPLVVSRDKRVILVYGAANIAVLFVFLYLFHDKLALATDELMDYAADNTVVIVFICVVAYNLYDIYSRAVWRAERDVAERRRAEEALRFKQSLLAAQAEASLDGILVVDETGRIISSNRRFAELWDFPGEIPEGATDADALAIAYERVADPLAFQERVRSLYEHPGESAHEEIELKDGRTFERFTAPVRGEGGAYLARIWFFRDITEKKAAEKALWESERRYRAVVEDQSELIVRFTPAGTVTFANQAYRRLLHPLLGLEGDFVGRNIRDIMQNTDEEAVERYRALHTREHPFRQYERAFTDTHGQRHWMVWNTRALFDETGRLFEFQTVGTEITARKAAEEALREARDLYHQVVSSVPSIVWKGDISQALEFSNTFLSEAAERILGIEEGALNLDWEAFHAYIHPEDRRIAVEAFREALEHPGRKVACEYRLVRPAGEVRWLHSVGTVQPGPGPRYQIFGFSEDITERHNAAQERALLEAQLMQAQKMETVGRLAGGVAHDFNNLLTAILGNLELAGLELAGDHPVTPRLGEIRKAADSAAALTRQLLAFSRKQIIAPELLDLNELIGRMHKLLVRLIGEDIELRSRPHPGLECVMADAGQLEQVIVNLAVNARDAMPSGGVLTIATADITLDEAYCRRHVYARPGPHVMLTVSDTGCGMTPEVLAHLFEPFFTTKPKGKGTGLGLATVYGAVKQNGGSIEVYSEPGMGTTFKIYLPQALHEAAEVPTGVPEEGLAEGTERILLVEDESVVRDFAAEILTRLGYRVTACRTAEEALQAFEGLPLHPELLITDVVLPGMNGRELAERLCDRQPGLRVLYTSGYTEDVIVHHGVLEEGLAFLGKPYTGQALTRMIMRILKDD